MDNCSDISDNSDIFHVRTLPDTVKPATMEDEDLAVVLRLKAHIREQPLVPNEAQREETGVTSSAAAGCKYPAVHCAIAGCSWHADFWSRSPSNAAGHTYHWTLERKLYEHLVADHGPVVCGGDGVMEEVCSLCTELTHRRRRADGSSLLHVCRP